MLNFDKWRSECENTSVLHIVIWNILKVLVFDKSRLNNERNTMDFRDRKTIYKVKDSRFYLNDIVMWTYGETTNTETKKKKNMLIIHVNCPMSGVIHHSIDVPKSELKRLDKAMEEFQKPELVGSSTKRIT